MPTLPELKVAEEAARGGAAVALHYYREGITMRSKDVSNLVSDADIEAERRIIEVIRRAYPNHEILGEEETQHGNPNAEHLWVIDPIDGTNNFAHRLPQFGVSVAYYRAGEPVCGVIVNPVRDEWHVAVKGQGATFNGTPVRVADHANLNEALIGVGFYYDRGAMMEATLQAVGHIKRQNIHGIRRFGAATLDLCMVGLGMLGAYFEFTLSPWDFAAGRLFVEEAGGKVTDCRGNPLPLARSTILASNGLLHSAMIDALAPYLEMLPEGHHS